MSTEDNKAIVRRFFEEVFNRQNLAVLDELVSGDFIHGQPGRILRGAEFFNEVKSGVHFLAFPDLHITIEDMIAEGDKVVARWTARGTHQGEAMGLPPTGNEVTWTGMNFMRVVNGKLAEDWEELDILGLMQQLGGTIPQGKVAIKGSHAVNTRVICLCPLDILQQAPSGFNSVFTRLASAGAPASGSTRPSVIP